jgi:uncharacterized protein (TIGR00369 family)
MTGRKVRSSQNVSRMCLVCGIENPAGLAARFYEVDNGELVGVFVPREEHQGYPGRMHGGVITALLDETIGRAINVIDPGTWGVTVEFTIRFRRPVPLEGKIKAIGRIVSNAGRVFEGTGEIILADGTVAAEARGKYVKMALGDIADASFTDNEWYADDLPLPAEIEI